MENINQNINDSKSHIRDAAVDLLNEGKKFGNELYDEGTQKVNEVEEQLKEYSDELLKKVQENPLRAILIAGGVGFLLSALLRK
jgi:ElaB/YqjD/DUF883 family membrane-anchored ribosome-binding protein